jgi:hypothetical protein
MSIYNRAGLSTCNASDPHSASVWFESRWEAPAILFEVFRDFAQTPHKYLDIAPLGHGRFLPKIFYFNIDESS